MISKNKLQSFISKYYLSQFNQANWKINNNNLSVHVGGPGLSAGVYIKDFPIEEAQLGVFDSNKLQKLIGITSGDLLLATESQGALSRKLNISDANFELSYSLASPSIIPKINFHKDLEWDIELDLTRDDIDNLLKAKNALSEYNSLVIEGIKNLDGKTVCQFTFGDNTDFSSKVTYQIDGEVSDEFLMLQVPFNSHTLKEILNVNKDSDTSKFYLSSKGLGKFTFDNEDMSCVYYITRNEQVN
tara:strand:- start:6916 stop:7647 length:732 start_codon:yes stop_codon:yes gene_type:complete